MEQGGIGWGISGRGSRVGSRLKNGQLMNEMINKKHLLSLYSIPGTMAKDCTWFVSLNPHSLWSTDRIQFLFCRWSNWGSERLVTCTRSPHKEVAGPNWSLSLTLELCRNSSAIWFWASSRGYRKEMWPNPDCFSNLPRHFVFTICNGKALILATWNWSWFPTYIEKTQFCLTHFFWKHDTLFL